MIWQPSLVITASSETGGAGTVPGDDSYRNGPAAQTGGL